jgi:hypothetical protein
LDDAIVVAGVEEHVALRMLDDEETDRNLNGRFNRC